MNKETGEKLLRILESDRQYDYSYAEHLSRKDLFVLAALVDNDMKAIDIANTIQGFCIDTISYNAVFTRISQLKGRGLIKRVNNAKRPQYRLTRKGRISLAYQINLMVELIAA